MSNFKSGSGDLDFGGDDESDENPTESASESPPDSSSSNDGAATGTEPAGDEDATESQTTEYPYFVRRNNVGDERDTRLELHVREKVTEREAEFRNELAVRLDTNEVSKTDAREFALLAAFQNPERVAELMREDGFGALS